MATSRSSFIAIDMELPLRAYGKLACAEVAGDIRIRVN
jgi:hypothetical protein